MASIGEHRRETIAIVSCWETLASASVGVVEALELVRLFDVIDARLLDEVTWSAFGLTDNDQVPRSPDRLLFPSFVCGS